MYLRKPKGLEIWWAISEKVRERVAGVLSSFTGSMLDELLCVFGRFTVPSLHDNTYMSYAHLSANEDATQGF